MGERAAADIAAATLLDTLDAVDATPVQAKVVAITGDLGQASSVAAKSVRASTIWRWSNSAATTSRRGWPTPSSTRRRRQAPGPVLLIASDTPQVTVDLLTECAQALLETDVVLALARDGGWWVLGVTDPAMADCLHDIPTSTSDTGPATLEALRAKGLTVTLMDELSDVDTVDDVAIVRERVRTGQPVRARDQGSGALTCWATSMTGHWTASGAGCVTTTAGCASCRSAAGLAAITPTANSTMRFSDLCTGPTIDLGCGPGRLVARLVERGVPALGVDQSATAVGLARRSGAPALRRDVFEPLPGTGRWQTVLLADGNVGLGGDPWRVLRRAASC